MSVDQVGVVDAIGVDNSTGQIVLTISDHLEWDGEHLLLLQGKLNTYLGFIESGELLECFPNAKGRDVLISLVCKYQPNESGKDFMSRVLTIIENAGMKFSYRVLGDDC